MSTRLLKHFSVKLTWHALNSTQPCWWFHCFGGWGFWFVVLLPVFLNKTAYLYITQLDMLDKHLLKLCLNITPDVEHSGSSHHGFSSLWQMLLWWVTVYLPSPSTHAHTFSSLNLFLLSVSCHLPGPKLCFMLPSRSFSLLFSPTSSSFPFNTLSSSSLPETCYGSSDLAVSLHHRACKI